jgi:hypothetical protein
MNTHSKDTKLNTTKDCECCGLGANMNIAGIEFEHIDNRDFGKVWLADIPLSSTLKLNLLLEENTEYYDDECECSMTAYYENHNETSDMVDLKGIHNTMPHSTTFIDAATPEGDSDSMDIRYKMTEHHDQKVNSVAPMIIAFLLGALKKAKAETPT